MIGVKAIKALRLLLSHTHFTLLFILLVLVTLGSFVFTGPLGWTVGILYIAYDTWLLAFVTAKTFQSLGDEDRRPALSSVSAPRIAVLVPARNEALALPACIDALRKQTDLPDEIIVIDDGSTDATMTLLQYDYAVSFKGASLGRSTADSRLMAWRKEHTGKARSLNEVWPLVKSDVIVTIDADTILEPEAIAAVRRAFAADPRLAAAGGVLAPQCRGRWTGRLFEMFQTFEYIRAFLARVAWTKCDALLLVSGAFAAYRKDVLEKIGGYDPLSLVEDYDVIHRLHRYAYERGETLRVGVLADARASTDAPDGLRAFLKQRQRWFSGFLQTQFKNRDMVGNPRYGPVGAFMLPIKTADTLQPVYGVIAFVLLLRLLFSGRGIPALIAWIIGAKILLDLVFHFWSVRLYYRWQGKEVPLRRWVLAATATLTEPVSFQLLRHAGALLGWLGFLRGVNDWAPQRKSRGTNALLHAAVLFIVFSTAAFGADFQQALDMKKAGKIDEAAHAFYELVEQNPSDVDSLEQLAVLRSWQNRYDDSIALWERLLASRPDDPDYHLGMARVLYWRGNRDDALREIDAVLAQRPRDVDALVLKGDVLIADEKAGPARAAYLKAKALAPDDRDIDVKIARAVAQPHWRLDAGYGDDHYTRSRGHEYGAYGQIGYTFGKTASLWLRNDYLYEFTQVDHMTQAGGSLKASDGILLSASWGSTPRPHFRPETQAEACIELSLSHAVTAILDYRNFHYAGGNVDTVTPGVRIQPAPWVNLEYRDGFSRNLDKTNTSVSAARLNFFVGETWAPYLAYASGVEDLPPLASAKVAYSSVGCVWNVDRRWALRVDYTYEDRLKSYQHTDLGGGVTFKF